METTGEDAGVKKRFYLHAAGTEAGDAEMLATSGSVFCVERGGGDVPDLADLGYPVTAGLVQYQEVMCWFILSPDNWRNFWFGTAPGPVHLLSPEAEPGGQSPQQRRDGAESIHVRARAFQQDFRNPQNVEVLFEALASTCLPESGYARAAGIFQSSGWGKSRTVCELWRKGVWVVYLSFASGTGYPEASSIKDWFLQELNQRLLGKPYMLGQLECMSFSLAYFVACLNQLNRLRNREKGITEVDFAGMLSKNGEEADRFWGGVREGMQNSLQIYEGLAPTAAARGTAADAWALWQADASGHWGKALQDDFERNQKKFSVLFVFDEARHLLGKDSANPHMNALVPVRRAAQAMDTYGVGMLLFMDTSSHVSNFADDKAWADPDPSDRVAKGLLKLAPPIWASFSADVPQEEWEMFFPAERTFQYISRPEWYVRYGRPLWWAQFRSEMEMVGLVNQRSIDACFGMVCKLARDKLLGGGGAWSTYIGCDKGEGELSTEAALSLLGVRLAFDVDPRCSLASSMVANNLLTVVSVSPSREHLWTAWNVEPLVAKTAADAMQTLHNKGRSAELYGKLTEALVAGWIDKGYAGELVARIILLYAVDKAMGPRMYCSVDDFCRSLVKKEEMSLPGILSAARLHFHAFRRVCKSADELTVEDFREAFERGYAIICGKEAWGVDLYIPAFCGNDNEALTESNMTIIYGQVKLREDEPTKVCYAKISPQFAGLKVMKSRPYLSLYMNVMRKEGSSCTVVPLEDIEKAVRSSSQSPITRAVQELERKGVSPARKKGKMHDKATDAWVNWLREVESNMQTVLAIKGLNACNLDAELLSMLETVVEASKQIFMDGEASCRKLLELQRGQLSCMFPHLNIGNYK